jgi:hypothetical protein
MSFVSLHCHHHCGHDSGREGQEAMELLARASAQLLRLPIFDILRSAITVEVTSHTAHSSSGYPLDNLVGLGLMDLDRGGAQLDMDRGLSKSSPSSPITGEQSLHLLQLPLLRIISGTTQHFQSFHFHSSSLHAFRHIDTGASSITMPVTDANLESRTKKSSRALSHFQSFAHSLPEAETSRQRKRHTKGLKRRDKWNIKDYLSTSEKVHKI